MIADRYHLRLPVEILRYDGQVGGAAYRAIEARLASAFADTDRRHTLGRVGGRIVVYDDPSDPGGILLEAGDCVVLTQRYCADGVGEIARVDVVTDAEVEAIYRPAREW